jgi:hypothetical protein
LKTVQTLLIGLIFKLTQWLQVQRKYEQIVTHY